MFFKIINILYSWDFDIMSTRCFQIYHIQCLLIILKLLYIEKWIQTRRALGIKALYAILSRFYRDNYKVIDQNTDWVLITKGNSKSELLQDRILDIELHKLGATEETWKLACKMLEHDHQ
ncbi:hypothetical protein EJD97_021682 [Solanum chilense]|uniref:Uncharacterized protein n=1 Tax=Solanum chilense TaxID=4083 RepID=A0A6N2AF52_SOLCI|nr:hypothetical protein EJD97_021682 [Solanum chilense]